MHVVFTLLMFALATAYRLPCEQAQLRAEPVGWQRWRRQLLEQTRDKVIVFAQQWYGLFPIAEFALLVGGKLKDVRQASGHSKTCWPSTGSQVTLDPYIGTLENFLAHV